MTLPERIGRFEICGEVASGGMATVSLARLLGPAGFDKLVALKCVHPHLAKERAFVEMFLDEARLASRIRHPNVCSVFDVGCIDGYYYLAMDFLEGVPLSRLAQQLARNPTALPVAQRCLLAASLLAHACEGLHAAHELKGEDGELLHVVHRDVSPQNLFVTWDGHLQVVDFGIARATGRLHHTLTSSVKGKIAYMSPEQLQDHDIDRRTDVWALGVVLWELLTLRRLFRKRTEPGTMHAVLEMDIPAPSTIDPGVPPELDRIVMCALSRDAHDRYPTSRAFAKELNRFISSWGVPMAASETAEILAELLPEDHAENLALVTGVRSRPRPEMTPATPTPSLGGARPLPLPLIAGMGLLGALVAGLGWMAFDRGPAEAEPSEPPVAAAAAPEQPEAPTEIADPDPVATMETLVEPEVPVVMSEPPVSMRTMRRQPMRTNPSVQEPVMVVAPSGPGELRVVTPGGWAELSVDGRDQGRTPARLELPSGSHTVELTFPNGTVVRRRVQLTPDGTRVRVPAP